MLSIVRQFISTAFLYSARMLVQADLMSLHNRTFLRRIPSNMYRMMVKIILKFIKITCVICLNSMRWIREKICMHLFGSFAAGDSPASRKIISYGDRKYCLECVEYETKLEKLNFRNFHKHNCVAKVHYCFDFYLHEHPQVYRQDQ